jgi:hypothetical protein
MSESLICLDRGPTRPTESVKFWRSYMRKFIFGFIGALTLCFASVAEAHGRIHNNHFHNRHWHHNQGWWVAPAIIGGVTTYALTRPYVIERPVIVQNPATVIDPQYVVIDGVTYQKSIMLVNGIQQEVLIKVPQ